MADKSNGLLPRFHFADDGVIAKATVPMHQIGTLFCTQGIQNAIQAWLGSAIIVNPDGLDD